MSLERDFPLLAQEHYTVTSDPDVGYNCIAYAAGDKTSWWTHEEGYSWPNASRTPAINSLVEVFEGLGFERCADVSYEEGFTKVALYEMNGDWTHASVQLDNGTWSSKLGPTEDINHQSPESVTGHEYGQVHCIMRLARCC